MTTEQMIIDATVKGLMELAKFMKIYNDFPEENRKDLAEPYLIEHGKPTIWPICINCGETFPGGYPLVSISGRGEILFNTPEGFKRYFNERLSIRTCHYCGQQHEKAVIDNAG